MHTRNWKPVIVSTFALLLLCVGQAWAVAPSITSLTPNSGAVGATVTIAGSNFGSSQGTSTVKFNGTTATATSWSSTSITVSAPSGATTGNVVVTVSNRASNGVSFTVLGTPSITSLSVTSGPVGTAVTINGSNFGASQGSGSISFNGTAASVTSWSATSIATTVPSGATTGNVVVFASGVNSNGKSFTVVPAITSLSPASGAVGASVTITGTTFGSTQGSSTVNFNGTAATPTSWSATSIGVPVPTGATTGNVVVTVSGNASNGVTFTVVPAPSITSLSTVSGAVGASVTITGSNFGSSQGTSTVKFNGTTATPTSWSSTSIQVSVPSGATTGNVVVHASGVDSNGSSFTVVPAPSITSLSITSGAVGASVTITGSNFGSSQGNSTVAFNGTTATPTSWSATSIAVTVPSGATTGNVVVHASGVDSNGSSFTVVPAPSITSLSITSGPVGASVTITGSNFGSSQGNSTVAFNGTAATPTSWSATSIAVTVPSGATTGNVVVHASGVDTNGVSFSVVGTPSITSLLPTSGAVGTSVTITGANFGATQGTSTVAFNGVVATPTSWSSATIVVPAPSGVTSGLVVVTVGGLASNGVVFTTSVTISGISPSAAPVGGRVTISGSLFGTTQGASTATFNGAPAAPTSWGTETIVTPVPVGATSGPVVVTVSGVSSNSYNFTVGPGLTALSPMSGAVGALVTLWGSGFGATQGSSTVAFNGAPAAPSSWSDTNISVAVPSGATTGVVVITVGGISSSGISFSVGPSISSLSPASGPAGTSVTISGFSFGLTQGQSTVTFAGVTATPTSWGPSRIVVPVPASAATGPVVVTVGGQASNGASFTVGTGTINGAVTRASDGAPIGSALVEALQSNTSKGTATTAADGTYTISNLSPGTYDLRVTATGYGTTILAGNSIAAGTPTTMNASLGSTATISGKVTLADGVTPLVGATVTALQGANTTGTSTTDTSGNYSISTLAAGSYVVQASAAGYKSQSQSSVSLTAGGTTTANFSLSGQSVISYDYDELGRLVGTVDSLGDAVAYSYDSVGNLLAISRNHSNQTAILYFTPQSGPVGTSVAISGTGFSTSPSQNTVKFNGTNATVNSATATQVLAAVPAGAITGPVTVTTPNGTVTSSTAFTVTASGANGTPTISGFTPSIGTPGTATTISGTNFDVAANDRTKFNWEFATVSSATSTSISAVAPLRATSGHISVATPAGTAISTSDFFVPPPGYNAGNVDFTGRMTTGGTFTGTIGTGGFGLVVFDGTAGRKVSLTATGVTSTSGTITINTPVGTTLASTSISTSGTFLDAITLPVTGTYTIVVGSPNGSLTLNLYDVVDFQGTITPGGSSLTATTTVPGQNATLTFSGTFGQQVGINLTNGSYSSCNLTLYAPNGSTVTAGSCAGATDTVNQLTLTANGTYKIFMDPQGSVTGSVTVQVTSISPVTAAITPGGSPVTVTTTVAGQDAVLTFSATPSQRVSLLVNSITNPAATVYVVNPDGTTKTYMYIYSGGSYFMDTQTLGTTGGTYTLWVQHSGTSVGSETLQLYNVPADATGTITIGGSPVSVATTVPGQNASLPFSGTSGQKVSISLSSGSYSSCNVTLKNPDGSSLTTAGNCGGATSFVDTATLGTNGTYTIFIDPQGTAIGGVTVQLNNDSDVTGTITPGGSPVTVTTTAAGQDARLTFSGTAGQRVSLLVSSITNPAATVYLVNPDGTTKTYMYVYSGGSYFMDTQTLGTTGTYTLWVQHNGTNVGSETLQLYNVVDATGTITIGGSAVTVTTSTPGQNASLTFSGTAGQKVSVNTSGSYSSCNVTLKNPDGSTLATGYCSVGSNFIDTVALGTTGSYTIFIDPVGTATGNVTVQLNNDSDVTGTITAGGSPVTVTTAVAGQDVRLTFSGTAGQRVSLAVTSVTNPTAYVNLVKPDGTNQFSNLSIYASCNPCFMDTQTLATTGTYTLWVQHSGTNVGSETLQLYNVPADATGTITIGGSAVTVTTSTPGQNGSLTFSGTAAQSVTVHLTNPSYSVCNATLKNPDGSTLATGYCYAGTNTIGPATLGTTGTYTIFIDPYGAATGSVTVSLTSP